MSAPQIFAQFFKGWKGIDQKANDLNRNVFGSISSQNCYLTPQGEWLTRPGWQVNTDVMKHGGLYTHHYTDTTGAQQEEVVCIDSDFKRLKTANLLFSNATNFTYAMVPDTIGNLYFELLFSGNPVIVFTCKSGTRFDGSWPTLAQLVTACNGVSGFTVTSPAGVSLTTIPAAILPLMAIGASTAASSLTIPFQYWETVSASGQGANAFSAQVAAAPTGSEPRRAARFKSMLNNCYFVGEKVSYSYVDENLIAGSGGAYQTVSKGLFKYDGQNVYLAGLPQHNAATNLARVAGGSLPVATYHYYFNYEQKDNRGNIHHGRLSPENQNFTSSGSQQMQITLYGYTTLAVNSNTMAGQISSLCGYNTNSAKVNGAQGPLAPSGGQVTVTVFSGHTMKAGDKAYFFNSVSGVNEEHNILGTTVTTIIIAATANVTVAANTPISNNLKVNIWRTKQGGTKRYLVTTLANDPTGADQVYVDNIQDSGLGICYEDTYPEALLDNRLHDPAPFASATALEDHQGLLTAGGDPNFPNTLYYSTPDSPEYWAVATNATLIGTNLHGPLRGLIHDSDDLMFVTKDYGIYAVNGDLDSASYIVLTKTEGDIGISSMDSIVRFSSGYTMGIGPIGPVVLKGGEVVSPVPEEDSNGINARVANFFLDPTLVGTTSALAPYLAKAINDPFLHHILIFIPKQPQSGSTITNGIMLVYDYQNNIWYDWALDQTIQPAGGFIRYKDEIYFSTKWLFYSSPSEQLLVKRDRINTIDNAQPITSDLWMTWDHGGEPSLKKHWNKIKTYHMNTGLMFGAQTTQTKIRIREYCDWDVSQTTVDDFITLISGTAQQREQFLDLRGEEARVHSIRFTVSIIFQRLYLSGFEYDVSVSSQKAQLSGR